MRFTSILTVLISIYSICLIKIIDAKSLEEKIWLRLYKHPIGVTNFEQARISEADQLFQESKGFNQTLPLVLMIHGIATGADCTFVNGLIKAFTKRQLTDDYNILAVDMPELFENSLKNEFYIGILANVEPAGVAIGQLLSKAVSLQLTSPEKINIIGYSMGSQVAGYAAREVKNSFGTINFIAGLDPAGPGFHMSWGGRPAMLHVSGADARITHFYHTNSVLCGTRDRVATADFVFNKGTVQPGCTKDKGIDCSHVRVPYLYIESVANPESFVARKCSSWDEFKSCNCNYQDTISITFPPDESATGIYYLRTRSKSPFALGERGSRCRQIVHMPKKVHHHKHHRKPHSKMSSQIKAVEKLLHPKVKEEINTHLIKGIKKIEKRQKHHSSKAHKRLDSSESKNVDDRENSDKEEMENRQNHHSSKAHKQMDSSNGKVESKNVEERENSYKEEMENHQNHHSSKAHKQLDSSNGKVERKTVKERENTDKEEMENRQNLQSSKVHKQQDLSNGKVESENVEEGENSDKEELDNTISTVQEENSKQEVK